MEGYHSGRAARSIRFPRLGLYWDKYRGLGISDLEIVHARLLAKRKQIAVELTSKCEAVGAGVTSRMRAEVQGLISQYVEVRERHAVVGLLLARMTTDPEVALPSWTEYSQKEEDWESLHRDADTNSFSLEEMIVFIQLAENEFVFAPATQGSVAGQTHVLEDEHFRSFPRNNRDKQAHCKQELVDKYWYLLDNDPKLKSPGAKKIILDEIAATYSERYHITMRTLERYITKLPRR